MLIVVEWCSSCCVLLMFSSVALDGVLKRSSVFLCSLKCCLYGDVLHKGMLTRSLLLMVCSAQRCSKRSDVSSSVLGGLVRCCKLRGWLWWANGSNVNSSQYNDWRIHNNVSMIQYTLPNDPLSQVTPSQYNLTQFNHSLPPIAEQNHWLPLARGQFQYYWKEDLSSLFALIYFDPHMVIDWNMIHTPCTPYRTISNTTSYKDHITASHQTTCLTSALHRNHKQIILIIINSYEKQA